MNYQDFLALFTLVDYGAMLVRVCELALRIPVGLFTTEQIPKNIRERRDQLFVTILADDLVRPLLAKDSTIIVRQLEKDLHAKDEQRAMIGQKLYDAQERGAAPEEIHALQVELAGV